MSNAFTRTSLFGTLFQDAAIAGFFSDEIFLRKMISFERAWTMGLMKVGSVEPAVGGAALDAIDRFRVDSVALARGSNTDGLPVPELIRQMRAGHPDEVQAAIHTGATSQDVIDTATVLTCLDIIALFQKRGAGLLVDLDDLDVRFGTVSIMGRTRMQAALPITVHDRIATWRGPLAQHLDAIPALIEQIGVVQAGGPVGLRDTPVGYADGVVADVVATLGLGVGPVWHSDRSPLIEVGHWLTKVTGILGKIGQDIALMAQQGIEEITLDGAGGSSAMPHKQNPIKAETLVTLARYVAAHQGILAQSLVSEQERSGTAWALEWMTLPAMFEATGAALNHANGLLSQIKNFGATP